MDIVLYYIKDCPRIVNPFSNEVIALFLIFLIQSGELSGRRYGCSYAVNSGKTYAAADKVETENNHNPSYEACQTAYSPCSIDGEAGFHGF